MPGLDLSSAYEKLAWAEAHYQTLEKEIVLWLRDNSHRIIYERNEDHTQHYLSAKFGSPPQLKRWALIMGDVLTNIRDALDHAIYAAAHQPNGPKPTKADQAAFIIRAQPQDFARDAKTRLCSVSNGVKDAVLKFQPFNRPHGRLPPVLAILAELANGTKHKLINVVLASPRLGDLTFVSSGDINRGRPAQFAVTRGGLVEGRPFAIFETPGPDPDCYLRVGVIDFTITVAHTALPGDVSMEAGQIPFDRLAELLFEEAKGSWLP